MYIMVEVGEIDLDTWLGMGQALVPCLIYDTSKQAGEQSRDWD